VIANYRNHANYMLQKADYDDRAVDLPNYRVDGVSTFFGDLQRIAVWSYG